MQINQLKNEKKELETKLINQKHNFEKQLQTIQNEYKDKISNQREKYKNDISNKINDFEKRISDQRIQLEEKLKNQKINYEKQIEAQKNEYESQISELQIQFEDELKNQKINYEKQIEAQKNEYESQISNQEKQITMKLRNQMKKYEKQIEDLKNKYESQITELQIQFEDESTNQRKKYEKQIEDQNNELEILSSNEDKFKSQIKKLKAINNELQSKVKEKKQQESQMQILNSNTINDLEIKEQISSNKYCSVFKVIKKETYAMKRIQKENSEMEDFKHFLNGYELIRLLNHPNIIKSFGIFLSDQTKTPPSILLEFCPNNLSQMIKNKIHSKVDIAFSLYQIAEGMKYLHSQKIIHRNLKPTNILITTDGIIKISDFSLSKMITEDELSMTLNIGKQPYTAPEIMEDENYDNKVDVYSYGVIIYFVLNEGNLPKLSYKDFVTGKKAKLPSEFTEFAKKLIYDCWSFDPKERPSFKTILDQIKENEFELLPLTNSEKLQVEEKIENLSKRIPHYSDLP